MIYVTQKTSLNTSSDWFNLCIIAKNESAMTYYRERAIAASFMEEHVPIEKFHMRENFSNVEVEEVDFNHKGRNFFRNISNRMIQSLQETPERVLQISTFNKNNEMSDEVLATKIEEVTKREC